MTRGLTCGMLTGSRALASLTLDDKFSSTQSIFVAGTANTKGKTIGNELHFFKHVGCIRGGDLDDDADDGDSIASVGVYPRGEQQCWDIASAPDGRGRFATMDTSCVENARVRVAVLQWTGIDLVTKTEAEIASKDRTQPGSLAWQDKFILAAAGGSCALLEVREGEVAQVGEVPHDGTFECATVRWDPHATGHAAIGVGGQLRYIDTRTREQIVASRSGEVAGHHTVTDIDFQPTRRNIVATICTGGKLRVWDLRSLERPRFEAKAHSHWACGLKYNPLHESLLVTCGTDGIVHLWDVPDAPVALGSLDASAGFSVESTLKPASTFPDHDTSVYNVCWASADEFTFASLSYDGRLRVNNVPTLLKNQLLLS